MDCPLTLRHLQPVLRDCQVCSGTLITSSGNPRQIRRAEGSQTNENLRGHDCNLPEPVGYVCHNGHTKKQIYLLANTLRLSLGVLVSLFQLCSGANPIYDP